MKRSLFTSLIALAAGLFLSACASTAPPSEDQVAKISTACSVDAGVRPTVTALLAVPGLASSSEIAAVEAARAVIDPICADPSAPLQASAIAGLSAASAQVLGLVAQMQLRRYSSP